MRTKRISSMTLCLALVLGGAVQAAAGQETTPAQKAEFAKAVAQRNGLHLKLRELDRKAADLLKQGRQPTAVHSQQIAVQDQLDLAQLKVETLAARFTLAVPPVPPDAPLDAAGQPTDPVARTSAQVFDRGRLRAIGELQRQGRQFLASLDFSGFLAQ